MLEELRKQDIYASFITYSGSKDVEHKTEIARRGEFGRTSNPEVLFQLVINAIEQGKETGDKESYLRPHDVQQLQNWKFTDSYSKYHRELVTLAKGIYSVLYDTLEGQPAKNEFYQMYSTTLELSELYYKRIAGKKASLPKSLYKYFAKLLAKYVMVKDWEEISSTYPPLEKA